MLPAEPKARIDGRKLKGEETRRTILEVVLRTAGKEGAKGLTAQKIAEAAGVSKANLFHHFTSMEEIIIEALLRYLDMIRPPCLLKDHDSIEHFLHTLIDEILEFFERDPLARRGYERLGSEYDTNETLNRLITERVTRNVGTVEAKVKSMIDFPYPQDEIDEILQGLAYVREGIFTYYSHVGMRDNYKKSWHRMVKLAVDRIMSHKPA